MPSSKEEAGGREQGDGKRGLGSSGQASREQPGTGTQAQAESYANSQAVWRIANQAVESS